MGNKVRGNTFQRRTVQSGRTDVPSRKKHTLGMITSQIWLKGHLFICYKFCENRLRGFLATMGQNGRFLIHFDSRFYKSSALSCCL